MTSSLWSQNCVITSDASVSQMKDDCLFVSSAAEGSEAEAP